MKQSILNFAMVLLMAVTSVATVNAQKTMDVSKFTRLDNDLMARVTKPVRDKDEGKLCALIRVVTTLPDLEVRADALGIVQQEKHSGEYWLYVPYGARSLSFTHAGFYPLLYQYALPIDEGTVYELRLSGFDTNTTVGAQNTNTQLFVLTHQPDEAKVFIDDMEMASENGVFASMMSKGEHTYKVTADQFEDVEGSFTLEDQPVRESAVLNPLFGTFKLETKPEDDFDISINGKLAGRSPFTSERLDPGSYRVHISKNKYYPVDTLIRLREGDNLRYRIKLTSKSDSLFYNRILGGRNISIGINAGYLMPFVSSKTSGDYTGSPINYSLCNSGENVSYSSQSGFTAGLFVDIRLYKNFYMMLGANYTQVKYTNKFDKQLTNAVVMSDEDYIYKGNITNSYEENYTLQAIEVPLMFSYRFVLTRVSSLHLNLGPYVSFGLKAKMKTAGSSSAKGDIYSRWGLTTSPNPEGSFSTVNTHMNADFDLYSKDFEFSTIYEGGAGLEVAEKYIKEDSPYKKFNYGLKAGITFEMRGFQLSANYSFQLSNMANKNFWEGTRIPIINGLTGDTNMSGYKHRIHALEIKLGYVLRY